MNLSRLHATFLTFKNHLNDTFYAYTKVIYFHLLSVHTGPDPRFVSQQLFFSRFLADFDVKLGVFGVEEFIFGKNIGLLLAIEPKLTYEILKYQLFKNNL